MGAAPGFFSLGSFPGVSDLGHVHAHRHGPPDTSDPFLFRIGHHVLESIKYGVNTVNTHHNGGLTVSIRVESIPIGDIRPYEQNPRINADAVPLVAESIREYGFLVPIVIDADGCIVAGHTRLKAAESLGLAEVPCIRADHLTEEQARQFRLVDNRTAEEAGWDPAMLGIELDELGLDWGREDYGFTDDWLADILGEDEPAEEATGGGQPSEIVEDEVPTLEAVETVTRPGDVWMLGEHRLMCGDSLRAEDVATLMDGEKAVLCFTDPPYGMGKESEGVANDNQNADSLLAFNLTWLPLAMDALTDVGSCYMWGTDEGLMDVYANFVRPEAKAARLTFRNLITWKKENDNPTMIFNGACSGEKRCFYPNEKALFWMKGVQGFNTNADHYFEGWEPIRDYLLQSRLSMGWDVPTMKKIVGHSDLSRDHWTSKSQFSMPTREVYTALQKEAERQRREKGLDNDAFRKEYDELRKEYYASRAYFDGTASQNIDVWVHDVTSQEERGDCGGHATPKPLALCARGIRSSSREGDLVLDLFGGSGSTLMACQQTGRRCFTMELSPYFCDVIVARWERFTGLKAERTPARE